MSSIAERQDVRSFIDTYVIDMVAGNAALFAGAGLSVAAGYVDWKNLLRKIASDLGLDIDRESNLIEVAQFHVNSRKGNRHELSQLLIEKFALNHKPTQSHNILARLPIATYWTTNYDRLLERALTDAGKVVDVKYTVPQLSTTKPRRDVVLLKMHGDVEHADDAVLTKDNYEAYFSNRGAFVTALSGDLVSKTFLFVGFSFTDPNLDYVLSRIRVRFEQNQRRHFCLIRGSKCEKGESKTNFEYRKLRQKLFSEDLGRFNIQTILLDEYSDVEEILRAIELRYRSLSVFISGAAVEFEPIATRDEAEEFLWALGKTLVEKGYRVVSGLGLGIGRSVLGGALEAIYADRANRGMERLVLRPFPAQRHVRKQTEFWRQYREEMIGHGGIAVFVFGNRSTNGTTELSKGMEDEFQIAIEKGLVPIPVGATGFKAEELWKRVTAQLAVYYPGAGPKLVKAMKGLAPGSKVTPALASRIVKAVNLAR